MPHNFFTLTQGSEGITAYNTMLDYFGAYHSGSPICAYIYIKNGAGQYRWFTPERLTSNTDPLKGEMFASYEVILNANELAGFKIAAVGFAWAQSPSSLTNQATVSIEKKLGEKLVIGGTLYLGGFQDGVSLTGGENRLAAILLGLEGMPKTGFALAAGTNLLPAVPFARGGEGMTESVNCTPSGDANRLVFSAALTKPAHEVLLTLGGEAVLRARPVLNSSLTIRTVQAAADGSVVLSEPNITDVFNTQLNGSTFYDYRLAFLPETISFQGEAQYFAGPDAAIEADAYAKHFAVRSGENITLCRAEGLELAPYYWIKGRDVRLFTDGTAAVFSDGVITLIKDGAVKATVAADCGAVKDVAYMSGNYLIAALCGTSVKLFYFDSAFNVTVLSGGDDVNPAAVHILRLGGDRVMVAGQGIYNIYTPLYEDAAAGAWLRTLGNTINQFLPHIFMLESNRLILTTAAMTMSYVFDIGSYIIRSQPVTGKAYDEFLAQTVGDRTRLWDLNGDFTAPIAELDGKLIKLFRDGNLLWLFFADGTLKRYLLSSQRLRLYSASIKKNDTVSCYLRTQSDQSGTVTVTLTP